MQDQRGAALSGLLFWCLVLAIGALLGLKVAPTVIEFYKVKKDCKSVVSQLAKDATVADVRKAYERYADIDSLELRPDQLDISKDNGQIVIAFAYEKRIPLFANLSLVIDYAASTRD